MATQQNPAVINKQFMEYSYEQPISANAQNGTAYATGTALNFDAPIVPGAYATKIRIKTKLTVNYTAAGTGPTESLNAGAPWNVWQQFNVDFGNRQITIHPYFLKVLSNLNGYLRQNPAQTLGAQSTNAQSKIYQAPTLNAGDNTWEHMTEIPLNGAHPMSPEGIIPISGSGTRLQIQLVPATAFVGADPLNNVVSTNGTVTVTGSVTVTVYYRSYQSFFTRSPLAPVMNGLATVQIIKPQSINPLTAGQYMFKRILNPYPVIKSVSVVVDGQSSSTFCSYSNIDGFEIDSAENTSSMMRRYDSTTGGFENYLEDVRKWTGQDFDDGVLVFDPTLENQANSSNRAGKNYLNLTSQGFPAARLGFNVGAVSSANSITPRVETYTMILNPNGILTA